MKTLFALVVVLGFSSIAANASSCREGEQHYWPSNNPALCQNSEGGACQDVLWTCVDGRFTEDYVAPAPEYRGCVEGDIQNFPVADSRNGGDSGTIDVPFVCHNGKYKRMYGKKRHGRHSDRGSRYVCKNGSEMYFEESDSRNGGENGTVRVLYTCKNGRFVRK
ncbi:MAG: hypothetical protein AB7K68_02245 [Bacteriovoracia bacterium]